MKKQRSVACSRRRPRRRLRCRPRLCPPGPLLSSTELVNTPHTRRLDRSAHGCGGWASGRQRSRGHARRRGRSGVRVRGGECASSTRRRPRAADNHSSWRAIGRAYCPAHDCSICRLATSVRQRTRSKHAAKHNRKPQLTDCSSSNWNNHATATGDGCLREV